MNLKDNLKKIRKDNNLSQEDLAEKLNVSRQSVSKWEQGLAYPEMDKVLQICKMFNLNIDEIMNQDIDKIEKTKQSKVNINKYVDDFLGFVTKTVKMFFSMKFKDKLKCIIEQIFIILVLIAIGAVLGELLEMLFSSIFGFLSDKIFFPIYHVFEGIYHLVYFIVAVILVLHIFKIRYLDYYVVVDKDEEEVTNNDEENDKEKKEDKKFIKEKEEKIIIRDPKHSEYGFINGIVKILLFILKGIAFLIGISFCMSLVAIVMALVISFAFVKTGLLFVGAFLGCLSLIVIHVIILYLLYSFIANIKVKKILTFIIFIVSLIVGGIACGLITISFKDFKIITDINSEYFITKTEEIDMKKELVIPDDTIEYIESDNNNIKIEYKSASYCDIELFNEGNAIHFYPNCEADQFIKNVSKDIKNKVIVDPDAYQVKIYTSKENIKLLKSNLEKYQEEMEKREIYELNKRIIELENTLDQKEDVLNQKQIEIENLKENCYRLVEEE